MSRRRKDGSWIVTVSPLTPHLACFLRDQRAEGKTYKECCAAAREAGMPIYPADITHHLDRDTAVEIDGEEYGFRSLFGLGQQILNDDEMASIREVEEKMLTIVSKCNADTARVDAVKLKGLNYVCNSRGRRLAQMQPRKLELSGGLDAPEMFVVPASELFGDSDEVQE